MHRHNASCLINTTGPFVSRQSGSLHTHSLKRLFTICQMFSFANILLQYRLDISQTVFQPVEQNKIYITFKIKNNITFYYHCWINLKKSFCLETNGCIKDMCINCSDFYLNVVILLDFFIHLSIVFYFIIIIIIIYLYNNNNNKYAFHISSVLSA